jgi:methionyl-tRNA synthetase
VVPEWRRTEALNFVKAGLEDFSISREVKRMSWGIPVPDDASQVMYVWFDALTNYISTLGWPGSSEFTTFWEEGDTLQLAGKDQVRFQSIMWQAMLKYHGFITSGGQKMSKSLGNVISPFDLVERYGTDATRYLLLRHVHPFEDTDITFERLDEWYNAHLANGLGNQVARIMKLAETHISTPVSVTDEPLDPVFLEKMNHLTMSEALDTIFARIQAMDEFIQTSQPFKAIKSEDPAVKAGALTDIEAMVRHLYRIGTHLVPFMPETAEKILSSVREHKMPTSLFQRRD